jgi:hypothetical protein
MGIENLEDLRNALRTKKRLEKFSLDSGLPQDYLTVLRRRAGSYAPQPIPLREFLGTDPVDVARLETVGIKHTLQLFLQATGRQDREELSRVTGVPIEKILRLTKLSDLSRAPYVGPAFAQLLYEAGLDTIAVLSAQKPDQLREKLVTTSTETGTYRAPIPSVHDFTSWLEAVGALPQVLEL